MVSVQLIILILSCVNQIFAKSALKVRRLPQIIRVVRAGLYVETFFQGFVTECITPDDEKGFCMRIEDCKILMDEILKENAKAYQFIRQSQCSPKNENSTRVRVCCGIHKDDSPKGTEIRPLIGENEKVSPFPKNCGREKPILENRIFRGTEAMLGEYPWMARLKHIKSNGKFSYGCVGFLISDRYVITAAHCLKSEQMERLGALYEVQLGDHNINLYEDCVESSSDTDRICSDEPQYIKTEEPIIYPYYNSTYAEFHYDIAIIPLKDPAKFTNFVQPICLAKTSVDHNLLMWVSGWGKTEGGTRSGIKLKVALPKANQDYCRKLYDTIGISLLRSQFCAGGKEGKDSCAGDSGGPLMVQAKNGQFFAEGIVSFGHGCGNEGWPGVYTSISDYYSWIEEKIDEHMITRTVGTRNTEIMANPI